MEGVAQCKSVVPCAAKSGTQVDRPAFCALMTPMGIGIGWGISASFSGASLLLAQAIIISITSGSFLFISVSELLPAALHDGRLTLLKIGTFTLGFTAMAVLAAFIHGGGH